MIISFIVTRRHLEGHASGGPYVRWRPVPGAQQHLQGPVLTRLDILREMMVLKLLNV